MDLLTQYARLTVPRVGAKGPDGVTISDNTETGWTLTSYERCSKSDSDWRMFHNTARLLQIMTIAYEDTARGQLLDVDLGVVQRTADYCSDGRRTIVPSEQAYGDHRAIPVFMTWWLLGRQVEVPLSEDGMAAAILALEEELKGASKFEDVMRELMP